MVLLLGFLTLALSAEAPATRKEVVYKRTPQGELKIHFFLPDGWKSTDQRPAILFFFGGGFTGGNPNQFFTKAEYLAGRGMVAGSAEYRIKTKHQSNPLHSIEDCASAVNWVREKAGEFGIDPKRMVGSGGSAGASCIAAATLAKSVELKALVLYNPPMSFSNDRTTGAFESLTAAQRDEWAAMSPVRHAKKSIPPLIQFFGTEDALLAGAREFHVKAKAAGAKSMLVTAAGQKHGFFNDREGSDWHEAVLVETDRFLSSLGLLRGEPTIAAPAAHPLKKE